MDAKKIILTTDIDLIKDGVQAIDDEFLEWFIKNPSCENVKVEKDEFYSKKAFIEGKNAITYEYKIIIPKEKPKQVWKQIIETCGGKEVFMESAGLKPKQETLEESSKRLCLNTKERVGFYKCYSWQQEQDKNKYSEEDMIKAVMFGELYQTEGSKSLFERKGTTPSQALVDFIDSFKKK
jgi:hypothetical protein